MQHEVCKGCKTVLYHYAHGTTDVAKMTKGTETTNAAELEDGSIRGEDNREDAEEHNRDGAESAAVAEGAVVTGKMSHVELWQAHLAVWVRYLWKGQASSPWSVVVGEPALSGNGEVPRADQDFD